MQAKNRGDGLCHLLSLNKAGPPVRLLLFPPACGMMESEQRWRRSFKELGMARRKMTELEQRMTEDLNWAEQATEVQQNPEHYGKFVIVYNKHVLAFGEDRKAVLDRAADRAGVPKHHLVTLIVPRPGLWEIPH